MVGSLRVKMMPAAAAVLLAATLSAPAWATDGAPSATSVELATSVESAAGAEQARAEVPLPKARPTAARKRIASAAAVRRSMQRDAYRFVARYERVAARWHYMFLGVGY